MKPKLPIVEECIKYILSCGFTLVYRHRCITGIAVYGFKRGDWTPTFTIHEIRDAFINGF